MAGPTALVHRNVRHLLGEMLLLMASEAEGIPSLSQEALFSGRVGIMATRAAYVLFLRIVFECAVNLHLLESLFLLGMAAIAQLRAFLRQNRSPDKPMSKVASLTRALLNRGVDDLLRHERGLLVSVALDAGLWGKATCSRPPTRRRTTRCEEKS